MKIGLYAGSFPTIEDAESCANSMIHGGVIQEKNGVFHVWYVEA
jgi:hypothetical protein